jgi:short-chain fatty acids transporter
MNNSAVLGVAIGVFPLYYIVNTWFLRPGGISNLTLNSINALLLFGAVLLWKRPINIVNQMKDSVKNVSGIIFMFPFYAGIAGLLTNTGLAREFTTFFANNATRETWPLIGVVISAVVNVFIPSGGGQWVAQGPILIETSRAFGYPPAVAVIIEILGDPLTNMIQPFWAIPLLAIADLRARDIIGYTAVAMVAGFLIVGTTVTVFIGLS